MDRTAIFEATLFDIIDGVPIRDLEEDLSLFEIEEMYEECIGLKCALIWVSDKTIKDIALFLNQRDLEEIKQIIEQLKDKYYDSTVS